MPKLKSILSRVVRGESRQKEDGVDYLCAGFERYMAESHSLVNVMRDDDDDDDGNSMTSFSTTATADNLPGTGRTVDTYIFQPIGKRIERLVMRLTIASLHPARIVQFILETEDTYYFPRCKFFDWYTLDDAIADLCRNSLRQNGLTVVAGMKGLVKQTQSRSIDRAASALTALIRVSLTARHREVYVNVSRIEPVFHLETLAGSLASSYPDKKWFLFLVKLAWETLIRVRTPSRQRTFDPVDGNEVYQIRPSPEAAQNLRRRLIRALRVYRSSGLDSLEDTIGEACAICAEAISTNIHYSARGDAYVQILETVYFAVIFVLRSIFKMANYAKATANRHIYMVVQTLAYWIDAIMYRCLYAFVNNRRYDMENILKANMAFRSLVHVFDHATSVLLPQSLLACHDLHPLYKVILPRRHREAAESADDIPIVHGLIETSNDRTRCLSRSFNELEREVCGTSLGTSIPTSYSQIDADPHWVSLSTFGDEWWAYWKKTLEMARKVQVTENLVTEEFREARRIGLERDPLCDPLYRRWDAIYDQRSWSYYQLRRGSRHKWGRYLRSNMDWEWDLGTCMKRLFKESHREQSSVVHDALASSPTIGVAASPEGALQLSFGRVQVGMPKEVQISYETEDGKMQYMSFLPAIPGPEQHPVPIQSSSGSSPAVVLNSEVVQQDSGYREGSFSRNKEIEDLEEGGSSSGTGPYGVQQDIEGLEAGASSSDASQPEACKIIAVEECDDGCEEKETAYDGVSDEVRAGGDTLSICSLD